MSSKSKKGFSAKKDNERTTNNAAQLRALSQMIFTSAQHLQQLQNEVATLAQLLRYRDEQVPATLDAFVLIDCVGNFLNEDGTKGAIFEGATLITHVIDMSRGDAYIEGFVASLVGKIPGQVYDVRLKFPDDYASKEVAGKELLFTISVLKVMTAPLQNTTILDLLKK